jgi:hypothetical protein
MKRWHVVHLAAALTLAIGALTLTACGGGGGGGGGGSSDPTARPLMALSADNAPETVQSVVMALAGGDLLGEGLMPLSIDVGTGNSGPAPSPLETLQEITRQVRRALQTDSTVDALSLADGERTTIQETFNEFCGESGSFAITDTSSTAGYIVFDNCVEFADGQYLRLDGRIDLTNVKFIEVDGCVDQFSARFDFRDLTAQAYEDPNAAPVSTMTVNGRANAEMELDYCEEPDWYRMHGDYLGFLIDGVTVGYYAYDIRSHSYWISEYSDNDYTATLDISTLPGSIHVTTLKLITQFWADDYPNGGVLRLDAANNGYLEMIINSAVYAYSDAVSIGPDINGDGLAVCEEVNVSWEELEKASWICPPPKPEL